MVNAFRYGMLGVSDIDIGTAYAIILVFAARCSSALHDHDPPGHRHSHLMWERLQPRFFTIWQPQKEKPRRVAGFFRAYELPLVVRL